MQSLGSFRIVLLVIFLIVTVLFVAIMLSFIIVRNRDNAEQKMIDSRETIASCRKQRYSLMQQMLTMFGTGNPQKANLSKLFSLYPNANTEEREMEWEKKYIPVMKAFMEYARVNSPSELTQSWQMANQTIIDNEADLTTARNNYISAKAMYESYNRTPKFYAVSFGDFIVHLFHQYNSAKDTLKKPQDSTGDDDNGTA